MEKGKVAINHQAQGYEISARRETIETDFYRFFYGESESEAERIDRRSEEELTPTEESSFLKGAALLFAAAVGTVLALLLI